MKALIITTIASILMSVTLVAPANADYLENREHQRIDDARIFIIDHPEFNDEEKQSFKIAMSFCAQLYENKDFQTCLLESTKAGDSRAVYQYAKAYNRAVYSGMTMEYTMTHYEANMALLSRV